MAKIYIQYDPDEDAFVISNDEGIIITWKYQNFVESLEEMQKLADKIAAAKKMKRNYEDMCNALTLYDVIGYLKTGK
jgi:hypothetical protein